MNKLKILTLDPQSNPRRLHRPHPNLKLQNSIHGVEQEDDDEEDQILSTFHVPNFQCPSSQTHLNPHFQQFHSPAATTKERSRLLLPLSATTSGDRRFQNTIKMGEIRRRKTGKNYVAFEIAEVRSGRKDRHSKVCTAKGPRDRRVRLAAHTAIQFYDVQDRLGYDRPSKAVDWLIKMAKSAIDELAELPARNPYTYTNQKTQTRAMHKHADENSETSFRFANNNRSAIMENHFFPQNFQRKEEEDDQNCYASISFFPLGASAMAVTPTSPAPFQSYSGDYLTGNGQQGEDLQLSLQSLHGHESDHALFSEAAPTIGGFDKWPEQHYHPAHELNQFQRTYPWNCTETYTGYGNEFFFSPSPPPTIPPSPVRLQPFSGETQFFLQRGPIQSTKTPFLSAFPVDPLPLSDDNPIPAYLLHQPLVPSLGISDEQFSASFDARH